MTAPQAAGELSQPAMPPAVEQPAPPAVEQPAAPAVAADEPRRTRGRVVMLTDNAVIGDSRVQKCARSAAAAGWEVYLLGSRGINPIGEWRIGDAQVRLVPVSAALAQPLVTFKRSLRRPLAYPPGKIGAFRLDEMRARKADITARHARLRTRAKANGNSVGLRARKLLLLAPRAWTKAMTFWVRLRARETRRLQEVRREPVLLTIVPLRLTRAFMGVRAWRKLDPSLWQLELAFGPVIDKLKPDIIHAHDFKTIGAGALAAVRARAHGRPVKFIYDAHEYVPGLSPRAPKWLPAQVSFEREFIGEADAVVTVSEALADMLQGDHHLVARPSVVANAPVSAPAPDEIAEPVSDIRTMCELGPETALIAYCGGITPVRGVDLMIDAMSDLPGVHLALMSLHPSGINRQADVARAQAKKAGVADRVHFLPYVAHWAVSRVLSTADVAVSPLVHLPNHEIALSNKFFEYSQARLPIVTSDVKTMGDMVRKTGQGEVFRAKDREDYLRAVRAVLADPERYRAAYEKLDLHDWTWEAQARVVDDLYAELRPDLPKTTVQPHGQPLVRPQSGPHPGV